MPQKIAQAEVTTFKRRDGTEITVQEWPTLVAMDALDDIVDGYDDLKKQGVIDKVMNLKLTGVTQVIDADGEVDTDQLQISRSAQADQFAGILQILKGYRSKVLNLLCSAIMVSKSQEDVTPEDLRGWFGEELYDLGMAVYEVNFVRGSLKKVRDKIDARSQAQTTVATLEETSKNDEPISSQTT